MSSSLPEQPSSSSRALIWTRSLSPGADPSAYNPRAREQWQPILHVSNQVVLYNPRSHALSIRSAPSGDGSSIFVPAQRRPAITGRATRIQPCPYCKQNLPEVFHSEHGFSQSADIDEVDEQGRWEPFIDQHSEEDEVFESLSTDPAYHSRASNYFRLLEIANDVSSQGSTSRRSSLSASPRTNAPDDNRNSGSHAQNRRRDHTDRERRQEEYRSEKGAFPAERMAEGYFETFFQEEYKLGMGASGSVFLCQHVLDGNPLGYFAVKKIAVGESHSYLYRILKEVRLLERLRHPNIISYHHAWLEKCQFSSFGPKVPTLYVLMQWAEGGSLDDFIDVRLGQKPAHIPFHQSFTSHSEIVDPSRSVSPTPSAQFDLQESDNENGHTDEKFAPTRSSVAAEKQGKWEGISASHQLKKPTSISKEDPHSRSAKIRAFRAYQRAPLEEKERMKGEMQDVFQGFASGFNLGGVEGSNNIAGMRKEWTAVHLLSADEVKSLFRDVVEGLGFLHKKSILHLDLKPGNVLLTWDDGRLIPRAMLSDFGTSRDMIHSSLNRSGNTGTLEYTAPESLPSPETGLLQQIGSKADMWSLGMILHKLLFFKLPYRYAAQGDANGEPINCEGEGEKKLRLEKEILAYPGFKSSPSLVSGFEGRRLPRTFLLLLENLLHKSPSERLTCATVEAAIRTGKLDPLSEVPSANLPLARPRVGSTPPGMHVSPPLEDENSALTEKLPLLALPSPPNILGDEDQIPQSWFTARIFRLWLSLNHIDPRRGERGISLVSTTMKLVRSLLLVVKVLTIRWTCPDPLSRPRLIISAFLLALAIGDTVLDHHDQFVQEGNGRGRTWRSETDRRRNSGTMPVLRLGRGIWITAGLALLHFTVVGLSSFTSGSSGGSGTLGELWDKICCVSLTNG